MAGGQGEACGKRLGFSGDTTPCWMTGVTLHSHCGDTTPCMTPVILPGVVSPEVAGSSSGFRIPLGDQEEVGELVSGFGFWVSGFGIRVSGFGFRVSGFGFRVSGFGFRVSGFGFRVSGFGFRDSGFGFRVSGFGCTGSSAQTPFGGRVQGV